jgi:hypothetical protein
MIDLQQFCADPYDPRIYLTRPFTLGNYTLASNGHILIRVDHQDGYLSPENMPENATNAVLSIPDTAYSKLGTETGTLPLAGYKPYLVECGTCAGTGKINTCPQCGGWGEICEDCETCDGAGCIPSTQMPALREKFALSTPPAEPYRCPECYGLGQRCPAQTHILGDTTLGTQYLLLAKTLPNANIYAFGRTDPALIVFDGGIGVLMPRRD